MATPASYVCPRCGAESFNLNDVAQRYCGRCHVFEDDAAEIERARARRDARQTVLDWERKP
jgi:ribosomal protein L37E